MRRASERPSIALIVLVLVAQPTSATVFLAPPEVRLTKSEKLEIEQVGCRLPYRERMVRIVGHGFGKRAESALAVCTANSKVEGKRIYRKVHCYRGGDPDWSCWNLQFVELRIGRERVRVVGDPGSFADTIGAVRFLMTEKLFMPGVCFDQTTERDTQYRCANASADVEGVIKVEKGGGWHLVGVRRASRNPEFRYLGERNYHRDAPDAPM